jgi:hypothetical protein
MYSLFVWQQYSISNPNMFKNQILVGRRNGDTNIVIDFFSRHISSFTMQLMHVCNTQWESTVSTRTDKS